MWTFALARLAGILLAGLCLGLLFPPAWLWVLLAACLYLGWQLHNLYRLDRWLRLRSQLDPPAIGGIWGDIIGQVVRLHRRKQFHKQRLVQIFRELRRSTAALPDGVIILSSQNEIVWFNRQGARLLGLRRPIDIGLRVDNLIRSPEFVRYLHGEDFAMPLVIRPPLESDLYLALQVVPYGAGQSLLLARDVTRQMRLEAMRKDFVANASHELRTPLFSLGGFLELLSDDDDLDPQTRAEFLAAMREQVSRLTRLATVLLDLSRLDAGHLSVARDSVELDVVAETLASDAGPRAAAAEHELVLAPGGSVIATGDEARLLQIGRILVENAIVHTPPGTRVVIGVEARAQTARLSVTDDGPGIPAEASASVFERFYRLSGAVASGSGLGLAIARELAELMGGRVELESGGGRTCFTLVVPLASDDRARLLEPARGG